jgi:hypothetical protein
MWLLTLTLAAARRCDERLRHLCRPPLPLDLTGRAVSGAEVLLIDDDGKRVRA